MPLFWVFVIIGIVVIIIIVILLVVINQSPPLLTIRLERSRDDIIGHPSVPDGTFLALCGPGKVSCQQNLTCATTHQGDQRCLLISGQECLFDNQCASQECQQRCR